MKIKDIMTSNLDFVSSDDTIRKAASEMERLNIGALPVKKDGKTAGIITDRDIVVRTIAKGFDPEQTRVTEAFTEGVISCNKDDDVQIAIDLMEDKQIRRVLVTDTEGNVTGIVALGDIGVNMQKEMAGEVLQKVSEPSQPAAH